MISIDGYQNIQKIRQERHIAVYEATELEHNRPVTIIQRNGQGLSSADIREIEEEFGNIKDLKTGTLLSILDFRKISTPGNEELLFICDGNPTKPFNEYQRHIKVDIPRFFEIALSLTETVNLLHQNGVMLKEINPTTLLTRNGSGKVLVNTPIVLLASASPLSHRAVHGLYEKECVENILPYISPEQTGRMNRKVDYRSDFYAMGVLFYELLTGRTPFTSDDPLEIIHAHIARQPVPTSKVRMDIPEMLSKITLRLLAKMPEDRYQSAFGLLSDLRRCHREYIDNGFISSFALGNLDAPEKLELSNKIFGREEDLEKLLAIFENVRKGSAEIFTIYGAPGIGKSRLADELQLAVIESGGYFISGKYDPFFRNTPYVGILDAFRDIVKKILGESPENLSYWRDRILVEMGTHVHIVLNLIPELECIVGPQEQTTELPPNQAEQQFFNTCLDFLRVFSQEEHPLVIFLDDMQWIDSASLSLIEYAISGPLLPHTFFIGAFRDNEVSSSHPLSLLVTRIKAKGVHLGRMELSPLNVEHIQQSIIASLSRRIDKARELAELIHLKTKGNPFFVGQFIQSLYLRKLLYFDYQNGIWRWDEQGIKAQAVTDNVIELMSDELKKLPGAILEVLKIAACIGNRFNFNTLAAANDTTRMETAEALLKAVDTGVIIAKDNNYRWLSRMVKAEPSESSLSEQSTISLQADGEFEFMHDRVRQVVYDMLPIQSRRPLHLKIGQLLLDGANEQQQLENIFTIVNQLSYGVDFLNTIEMRNRFARLYRMAGMRAKNEAAYLLATNYLNAGIALLSDDCWENDYDLAFDLYREKMECSFLSRNYEEADRLFSFMTERIKSPLDRASLLDFRIIMYASSGKYHDAVAIGLEALKQLGINFPVRPRRHIVMARFLLLRMRLSHRRVKSLSKMEEISDPRQKMIMKLLEDIAIPIYITNPNMYISIIVAIFDLTLKYGTSPTAGLGYAIYGAYLCAIFDDYELGNHLGELALASNEQLGRPESRAKVLLYYGTSISFWRHHMRFGLECSRKGLNSALENGDLNFACYHIHAILIYMHASGAQLDEIDKECKRHMDFVKKSQDPGAINYIVSLRQTIKCLRDETKNALTLDDDDFLEVDHLQILAKDDIKIVLLRHYLLRLQLLYLMEDFEAAMEVAQRASRLTRFNKGTITITEFYFYRSMTMLALYHDETAVRKRQFRRTIRRYIKKFTKMTKNCEANFRHKLLIILGEKAKVDGDIDLALTCFKDAAASAQEHGFIQMAALANELSARMAMMQGHHALTRVFVQEANAAYLKWGATAKSRQLVRKYPQFLPENQSLAAVPAARQFDYAMVVSALQAISIEIVLDKLLKKLMKNIIENVGAQRVLFILNQDDNLEIKASCNVGGPIRITNQPMPVQTRDDLLLAAIHFVKNTHQSIVIDDAQAHNDYRTDPYVIEYMPKSIFCLPVLRQSDLIAIVYLENNIVTGAFTPDRIEILQLIASQAAISIENARLFESVRQKERDLIALSEKLRSLSSELLLTEERERRRIAVDLHDRIGHALANVKMQLGALKLSVEGDENQEGLHRISELIDQSIQDTQSLTFDLSPPVLYDLGLEAAIEWLVDQMQEQYRIDMTFIDDEKTKPLDESLRVLAFQASRELLFNMVKHAHAHHAWVSIKRVDDTVRIDIEDDGIGMQASMKSNDKKRNRKQGGFGLFSIQQRLEHFDGRLDISSEPGEGTRMTLIVPMHSTKKDRA